MWLCAANHIVDVQEISTAFYLGLDPAESSSTGHILLATRVIPSVRYVVAATASSHLANRLGDEQLQRRSLHLRVRATELLRAELESKSDYGGGPDVARLLCMVLLAQLDVRIASLHYGQSHADSYGSSVQETVLSSQHISTLREDSYSYAASIVELKDSLSSVYYGKTLLLLVRPARLTRQPGWI